MANKKRAAKTDQTRETAQAITRRSGQVAEDKAQRRAVTQAIADGIKEYKLQQKAKQRDQDKKLKKAQADAERLRGEYEEKLKALNVQGDQAQGGSRLPWVLLAASWLVFAAAGVAAWFVGA
ncbi:Uncharacterised protein [BD1-7 clade bacterium]|uniref:DUF2956 domain-containing protein n=1 Tax=BD1-7 clade bacterium TaxID=2029982 RepID=A0A5S9QAU0_9GAMM|nr:Uncharacterised protein [BD1-7 clade bacterium]CAA0114955.1 Uncharacterised protein [BD1-7 clade bacterium]